MSPELRAVLYELARECGGFRIIQNGVVESVWVWDVETDRPRRVG